MRQSARSASVPAPPMRFAGSFASASGPITCTWCGTRYPSHQRNCTNCGGPLPGPTPPDPGPEPPPPPREVPAAYERHLTLTGNVPALIGVVFVVVGTLTTIPIVALAAGDPEMAWAVLAGLPFVGIGAGLAWVGLRRARRQLRALRAGVATRGEITDLHQDTTESINGRHPWAVVYAYEVGGVVHEGTVRSWDRAGTVGRLYGVGSPVHVLYLRDEPDVSALYPPIR